MRRPPRKPAALPDSALRGGVGAVPATPTKSLEDQGTGTELIQIRITNRGRSRHIQNSPKKTWFHITHGERRTGTLLQRLHALLQRRRATGTSRYC